MFTLIKKTSVHKDTKVVSNQKYDAILGRIYTISHLLSLERLNRISKTSPFVKGFLEAIFLRRFDAPTDTFIAVARFGTLVETVTFRVTQVRCCVLRRTYVWRQFYGFVGNFDTGHRQ